MIDLASIIGPENLPRCDRCNMPVQSLSVMENGFEVVFVAQCHGEVEETTIPLREWANIEGITFEVAFGQPEPQRANGPLTERST